ncbi:hypothetical protein JTE90_016596 [Oedothorax gibbosus]|uniref:UDP-N-acetylglucosamine transferase subunit ALG13 n=1 Tax=Oedothorax gibbosus TaxID=931172 RepID=A0AAV6UB46_9ARAC|nr:hypothetical protein JTE90_016596 [Oedothorax gibbosus]
MSTNQNISGDTQPQMSVFVTVGSTEFDALVSSVCSDVVLDLLAENKIQKVVLQVGRGKLPPQVAGKTLEVEEADDQVGHGTTSTNPPVHIEWFRYMPSLTPYITSANLVIGHAGAGTLLECCTVGRPLVCVPNGTLLHGHQMELAEQMEMDGQIRMCPGPGKLAEALRGYFKEGMKTVPMSRSEPEMFSAFLEEFVGLR